MYICETLSKVSILHSIIVFLFSLFIDSECTNLIFAEIKKLGENNESFNGAIQANDRMLIEFCVIVLQGSLR